MLLAHRRSCLTLLGRTGTVVKEGPRAIDDGSPYPKLALRSPTKSIIQISAIDLIGSSSKNKFFYR